jgi:NO-binding membrane sensor protein with MHYT domain
LAGIYNPWLVVLSVAVAIFVSHTALRLSARVARKNGVPSTLWVAGGALAMGGGIWSMHFIGMLAFSLPIALAYDVPTTITSLFIAIVTSAFALVIANRPQIRFGHLFSGALLLGGGISAMHYVGMAAIQITPMITYEPVLLALSIGIAIAASFVALWLFFRLRRGTSLLMRLARVGAAFVMGLAISGMHYTGMAASRFSPGSFCIGAGTIDQRWLALTIAVPAIAVLAITTILLIYDGHLDSRTRKHNAQLEKANAQLEHAATHDALTGLPNRVLLADRLAQATAPSERYSRGFAVLVVDLDRFKSINDSLGHIAGDDMLKEVARRLSQLLRKADTLARLVTTVREALAAAGLDPGYLELELTESAVMQDPESSIQVLRQLSGLGVRISVDDFGTGYSSLSYLRRLPLDKLKIDRSFISGVAASRDDAEIVRAIVSLAHSDRYAGAA